VLVIYRTWDGCEPKCTLCTLVGQTLTFLIKILVIHLTYPGFSWQPPFALLYFSPQDGEISILSIKNARKRLLNLQMRFRVWCNSTCTIGRYENCCHYLCSLKYCSCTSNVNPLLSASFPCVVAF
jgi:hypothetical protein